MKKTLILRVLVCLLFSVNTTKAQNATTTAPHQSNAANKKNKLQLADSLKGFDEEELLRPFRGNGAPADEYVNYIAYQKRLYINKKYNIGTKEAIPQTTDTRLSNTPIGTSQPQPSKGFSGNVVNAAPCVNENFESSPTGQVFGNTLAGWTVESTLLAINGTTNTCQPGNVWALGSPKLFIHNTPIALPLAPSNVIGALGNSPLGGAKVAQLNDLNASAPPPNGSMFLRTRIRQTFPVTPTNAFFQFAYAGAWEGATVGQAHIDCCEQASFIINFYTCNGMPMPCGQFLVSPGPNCLTPNNNFNICAANCYTNAFVGSVMWTNWQVRFMDLTPYINQCVTVEIICSGCRFGGHVGTLFFDSECTAANPLGQPFVGGVTPVGAAPTLTNICRGGTANLTAFGVNTYTWFAPPANPIGQGPNISVSPTVTTNYTVNGSVPGCSVQPRTVLVRVFPKPNITVTAAPNPVCSTSLTTLTANGALTYTWQALAPPINGPTKQVFPIATTTTVNATYTVIGTNINGCTNTAVGTVTVMPQPTLTAVANPTAICQGFSTRLTAGGATNYQWVPGFSGQNPYIVTPSVTTNYSVTGTGTNGCLGQATVNVFVLGNPTITVLPSSICTGITNTIIASGATSYTYYVGGTSPTTIYSNVALLNLTSPTPYTLCASNPGTNSCVVCVSNFIPMGVPIPITAPAVTLCTNAGSCTTISASTAVTPVNFNWQPGNLNGANVSVCPTVATTYTVYATSSATGSCPNNTTVAVSLATNCCPGNTQSLIPLPVTLSGLYANGSYILTNNAAIATTATFVNSEVLITPSVQITVPPGSELVLDNAHLFACGIKMWQGIKVDDGGRISTPNFNTRITNSMIEDAEIAIELDNINSANVILNKPAIEIQRVIFNKNFIGIKISNSDPGIDSLELGIEGCVFASKNLPFTSWPLPLSWPSSSMAVGSGGLRMAIAPVTGLAPPYLLNSLAQATLKIPHATQVGHIGIQIQNIGDPNGYVPKAGVCFGDKNMFGFVKQDFNLFEGLGRGIEVINASLSTNCNVFESMERYNYPASSSTMFGGEGIYHQITDLRNARLNLPTDPINNKTDGCRFWDCYKGIVTTNVHDVWIDDCVFRSRHTNFGSAPLSPLGDTQGDIGVENTTNRFDFTVRESEFNNVRQGILFSTPLSTVQPYYEFNGNGPFNGILATGMSIERNYFGAQVNSTVALGNEYMSDAITIQSPNVNAWQDISQSSYISSNKFNRIYRGVHIDGMSNHVMRVGGNEFLIDDDFIYGFPEKGWGVMVENKLDHITIESNTLQAMGFAQSTSVSLIWCDNNYGFHSPIVQCNTASNSKFAYEFSGFNLTSIWRGNDMCNHFGGLALTNSAVIGPQGSWLGGHGNSWNTSCTWTNIFPERFQTFCDNSDPVGSELHVLSPSALYEPTIHGRNAPTNPLYVNGPLFTVVPTFTNFPWNCLFVGSYVPPPNWRTAGQTTSMPETGKTEFTEQAIGLYPNPTNGKLLLVGPDKTASYLVTVRDVTGKRLLSALTVSANNGEIDLITLPASLYLVEIQGQNNAKVYKKIVKID